MWMRTSLYLLVCFVDSGPGSVRRVKRELAHLLRQSGFRRVQDAVGTQAGAFVGICGEKIEQELCQESCDCDAK